MGLKSNSTTTSAQPTTSANGTSTTSTTTSTTGKQRRGWFGIHRNHNSKGGGAAAAVSSTANERNVKNAANRSDNSTISSIPSLQQQQQQSIAVGTTSKMGILKKDTKDYDAVVATQKLKEVQQQKGTSWLCRTNFFQSICQQAFVAIDSDQSNTIDEKELYAGLLLIHLQLGCYAGPAACRPLSRDAVHTIFLKMDHDQSGTLNQIEFNTIMSVLFSNVLLRVIVQWSCTICIVPWLAQFILSCILSTISYVSSIISNLDEHSSIFNFIELTIEGCMEYIYDNILPNFIKTIMSVTIRMIQYVPISVWKALPLTILSTLLGIIVVPYCIHRIDHYFQQLADYYHKRNAMNNNNNTINPQGRKATTITIDENAIPKSKTL